MAAKRWDYTPNVILCLWKPTTHNSKALYFVKMVSHSHTYDNLDGLIWSHTPGNDSYKYEDSLRGNFVDGRKQLVSRKYILK